jgi:hypothetical protein
VREVEAALLYASTLTAASEASPNGAFAPGGGPLAFGAWVKRSFQQVGATNVVLSKGRAAPNANLCWALQYTNTGLVAAAVSHDGSTTVLVTSTATFLDLSWHHVVGVYSYPHLTVYVDGAAVATSSAAPAALYASPMPVGVGVAVTSSSPTFAAPWSGAIAEAFVTTQALDGPAISAIMQRGAWTVLNGAGVAQAVWPADEGTGTTGADLAGGAGLTYLHPAWDWLSLGRLRNQLQLPWLPMGVAIQQSATQAYWNAVALPNDRALINEGYQPLQTGTTGGLTMMSWHNYGSTTEGDTPRMTASGGSNAAGNAGVHDEAGLSPPVTFIAYNPEEGNQTPNSEIMNQAATLTTCGNAASLAQTYGFPFAVAPDATVAMQTGTFPSTGVGIALLARADGSYAADYLIVQAQQFSRTLDVLARTYDVYIKQVYAARPTGVPPIKIILQVSPAQADVAQMLAVVSQYLPYLYGWTCFVGPTGTSQLAAFQALVPAMRPSP